MNPTDAANVIAEALRVTWDTMSATDKKNVQAAILRGRRKALNKVIKAEFNELNGGKNDAQA